MKLKLFTGILYFVLAVTALFGRNINIISMPESVYTNSNIMIAQSNGTDFKYKLDSLFIDNQNVMNYVLKKSDDFILLKCPENLLLGSHKIKLVLNNVIGEEYIYGEINFTLIKNTFVSDSFPKGSELDPTKQNDTAKNYGENPQPIPNGQTISNPPGGYYKNVDCNELHKIDGKFTDSVVSNIKEWSGIVPLQGKFSKLYMDYCPITQTMYLLNDWYLGKAEYDSNSCYNLFEFYTASGKDHWRIKVFHSIAKGMEVLLNGIDVSKDTNVIVGGAFSKSPSENDTTPHTIYEFGIKTESGIYYWYASGGGCDPANPPIIEGQPSAIVVCDDNGIEGYGLVKESGVIWGEYSNNGTSLMKSSRYIPQGEIAGLIKEPNHFNFVLSADSAVIRMNSDTNTITNKCSGLHIIDGKFSTGEWVSTKYLKGKFTNLYGEYCNGVFYLLNDWIHAVEEPDGKDCYNLFEGFGTTGDGSYHHLGLYIYNNSKRAPKVFLDGIDISDDTNKVLGGKYSFGNSNVDTIANAIYEFGIKLPEGNWWLDFTDPYLASFCDCDTAKAPRIFNSGVGIRKYDEASQGIPGEQTSLILANTGDTVKLAIGTNLNSEDWWGKKFIIEIPLDSSCFQPISINKSDIASIGTEAITQRFYTNRQDQTILRIEGSSKNFFNNTGDLCYISAKLNFDKCDNIRLQPSIYIANSTTIMRKSELSPINIEKQSTGINLNSIAYLSVYPNPITEQNANLIIKYFATDNSAINLTIINLLGQTIKTITYDDVAIGDNLFDVPLNKFNNGAYLLKINTKNNSYSFKINVLR